MMTSLFSMRSAPTARPPTAPARWIFTGASSARGISTSCNSPTTAPSGGGRANGISAGRWKAAPSRTSGSCRRAANCVAATPPQTSIRMAPTLRVYDPRIDAWRIQWTDPVTQNFLQMIGRARWRRYRSARDKAGRDTPVRWSFSEITRISFLWRGEISADQGASWQLNVEFTAKARRNVELSHRAAGHHCVDDRQDSAGRGRGRRRFGPQRVRITLAGTTARRARPSRPPPARRSFARSRHASTATSRRRR